MFFHGALLLAVFPDEKSLSLRFQGSSLLCKKTRFFFRVLFFYQEAAGAESRWEPGTRCSHTVNYK